MIVVPNDGWDNLVSANTFYWWRGKSSAGQGWAGFGFDFIREQYQTPFSLLNISVALMVGEYFHVSHGGRTFPY